MTALLGMEWTSWRHFARSMFFHSSRMTSFRDWMLNGEWCSTCLFKIPHRCSIGFRSGDILGHWITFTLFFFRNPTVAFDVCLGSLSCWKSARRPRARSDGIQRKMDGAYSETWWWQCPYVGLHECCWCRGAAFHWWHHEFTNVLLSDTSSTHAAPHKDTATTMFHCRHHAFFFVFLTFATPYSFEAISSKNVYLGLITPEYRVPVVFIFVSMGPGKL